MKLIIFVIAAALHFGLLQAEQISPGEVTTWGTWRDWEHCPSSNPYVVGFQLKVETWIGVGLDDTSLNGIKLYCGDPVYENVITSGVGSWGKWRNSYRCAAGEYITGFQLRVEKNNLIDLDETATNNARFFCAWNTTAFLEGDGERWGSWGQAVHCPNGEVVCGIQTRVQKDQGILLDDTALNSVKMDCCPVENNAAPAPVGPAPSDPASATAAKQSYSPSLLLLSHD